MSAVLVVDVEALTVLPDLTRWMPGPLPVIQPENRTTRTLGHVRSTDENTRRTIVALHQADAVYGTGAFERKHWRVTDGGQVVALEMLWERDGGTSPSAGFLAVHVIEPVGSVSEENGLSWWSDLLRDRSRTGAVWQTVAALLGGPIKEGFGNRHLAFMTAERPDHHGLGLGYAAIGGLATEVSPDLLERAGLHEWTLTKPDWSVLVLRDGTSFVAHQTSEESFAPTLRMLMHTIHLDALLLALLQRQLIDRSGDLATKVDLEHPDDLVNLEKSHYDFKRKYWRTSITDKRTAPPDVVFQALQEQLLTTLDVNDVETRVRDGARLSLSLSARQQEASARQQEAAQERLTHLVQTATAVFGAFSLCYTAAPVLTTPSWEHFLIATAVAIPLAIAIFVFLVLMGRRSSNRGAK